MSRTARWLLATALLTPLAGCGGSADAGSAPGAAPAADGGAADAGAGGDGGDAGKAGDCDRLVGVTICMAYDLTGDLVAAGHFPGNVTSGTDPGPETCAEWVTGAPDDDGTRRLFLPQGGPYTAADKFAGLTGDIVENYTGPGTYGRRDLTGQGSPAGIITPQGGSYNLLTRSTATVTVAADGSGSFTFTGLGTLDPDQPGTVSGSVTWTCHNP